MTELTDDELSSFRRAHLGRALARARWTFEAQFEERIRERGFEDFRPSDVDVIARVPIGEGARITEIAARSHVSKQAIGKLVRGLEERGYVTREPDELDGRAVRIVLTLRGRELIVAARAVVTDVEEEWAEVLSAAGLKRLKRALLKVSDALGPEEFL